MIRVLHVVDSMNYGGIENFIMNIYRKIDKNIIQFDFVEHSNYVCKFDNEITKSGGAIYRAPKFKIYNYYEYLTWWKKFFIAHKEYRIIHAHITTPTPIYLKEAKKNDIFTIAHAHNTNPNAINLLSLIKILSHKMVRGLADYYFACSTKAAEDFFGKNISNSNKCEIVNNGIDVSRFVFSEKTRQAMRKELNVDNCFVIGNIGRFTKQKNQLFLIKLLKYISNYCDNVVLLLVGDGQYKERISKLTEKMNLTDRVIFAKPIKDVEKYYSIMDVFVLPSLFEGLGMVLVEAQINGLYCITSKNIQDEAIIDSNFVKKLDLSNKKQWCDELLLCINSNKIRTSQIVDCKYDSGTVAEKMVSFYKRVAMKYEK